jgi:serine/threonine protein kinase/tetratricopeptide (TPR) repeat protein
MDRLRGKPPTDQSSHTRLREQPVRSADRHDSSIWEKGQTILGEYIVEGTLGEGGMGTVYLLVRSQSTGYRFAVKKTRFRDEASQRNFLMELQTWLDLPDHPHLVACQFFRTVDHELVIFGEYVEGGSLATWMAERRLTQVDQMLDVAIQFAWGLHALHELGLVHQDVKPGNVLMTRDGVAKASDFGLARARAAAGEHAAPMGRSILLSCGGMTEAYCSPEQATFQSLTRKTDIWSWGVSVLEMFTGAVMWGSGAVADKSLEGYVDSFAVAGVGADGLPLMPVELVQVLRKCFRSDPRDRWDTMLDVADVLKDVYRECTGRDYPRNTPAFLRASERGGFHDRRTDVAQWGDPREWVVAALKADGRDPIEAASLLTQCDGTRQAQVIADLASYDAARRIFERLIANGRKDLVPMFCGLCFNKALLHEHLDDAPGALALYDDVIGMLERLANEERRRDLATQLAGTFMNKGTVLHAQGDLLGAVTVYDRALTIYERLVIEDGPDLAPRLARTFVNKGLVLEAWGDLPGALTVTDRALAIYERLVNEEGRRELAPELTKTLNNKGLVLKSLGDLPGALTVTDRALAIYERLVNEEGRWDLAAELATTFVNKANALQAQGVLLEAGTVYDRALAIYERLVNGEGRRDLAAGLATTLLNKGIVLGQRGDLPGAVTVYDRALAIYERLVNEEGRRELVPRLASTLSHIGIALELQGDLPGAVTVYDRALAIYERLVNGEGRREFRGDLGRTVAYKAAILTNPRERVEKLQQARFVLEEEVRRTGRADLKQVLDWTINLLKGASPEPHANYPAFGFVTSYQVRCLSSHS